MTDPSPFQLSLEYEEDLIRFSERSRDCSIFLLQNPDDEVYIYPLLKVSVSLEAQGKGLRQLWQVGLPPIELSYATVRQFEGSEEQVEQFIQNLNIIQQMERLLQGQRFTPGTHQNDILEWDEEEELLHATTFDDSSLQCDAPCTRVQLEAIREEIVNYLREFLREVFGVDPSAEPAEEEEDSVYHSEELEELICEFLANASMIIMNSNPGLRPEAQIKRLETLGTRVRDAFETILKGGE